MSPGPGRPSAVYQLEGVQKAVDNGGGERCAHLLEQRGNLPAQLPVWQHLLGTARIAAEFFLHRWHRQGVAVVHGQQFGFLTGAHGFQVGIAQRVEGARLRRLAEHLELRARPLPGHKLRSSRPPLVAAPGHRRLVWPPRRPCIPVVATQLLRHGRQVVGVQRHAHRLTGQLVHGEAGSLALGEPDTRVVRTAEGVAGGFHLPASNTLTTSLPALCSGSSRSPAPH